MNSCPAQTESNNVSVHKYHKDTYLSISQAAELLGISPSTLRRFETMGKIASVRQDNGYRSFGLNDIDNLRQMLQSEKVQEELHSTGKKTTDISNESKFTYVNNYKPQETQQDNQPQKTSEYVSSSYSYNNQRIPSRNLERVNKSLKKILAPEFLMLGTALVISGFIFNAASLKISNNSQSGNVKSTYHNKSGKINPVASTNSLLGGVLGVKDNITDFILNINVPTNISNTLTVTNIAGVNNIDATTEDTLERLVDINGDVVGTGLTDVKLADEISYDGNWDFAGTWSIDGTEVTITGDQLNTLSELADVASELTELADVSAELVDLAGVSTELLDLAGVSTELLDLADVSSELVNLSASQVVSNGIPFGDGVKYIQDIANLYWNDTTNRLGIGTSNPLYTLTVNGDASFADDVIGPTTGIFGYWVRTGTILSPTTPSDEVNLSGTLDLDGNLEIADTNIVLNGLATTFTQSNNGDLIFTTAGGGNFNVELAAGSGDFIVNTGTNDLHVDTDQHRVGIGTAAPSHKLQVVGNIGLSSNIFFGGTTGGIDGDTSYGIRAETGVMQYKNKDGSWFSIGSGGSGSAAMPVGSVQYNDDGTAFGGSSYFLWNKVNHYLLLPEIRAIDNSTGLSITDYNGNLGVYVKPSGIGTSALVGISTSNPTHQLDVFGDIYASAKIATATDFYVGAIGLGTTAGSTIVGVNPNTIDNVISTNVQGALEELGSAITSAANGGITEVGSVSSGPAFVNVATGYNQWLGMGSTRGRIGFTTSPSGDVVYVSGANLGVGTTDPGNYAISASGDINISGTYLINGSSINNPGILNNVAYLNQANAFGSYNQTFDTNTLYINASSDRVGIGTTDPTSKLDVAGEVRSQKFSFGDNTNVYMDTFGTNNLVLATDGTDRLTITAVGRVGIGTTAPGTELDVLGSIRASNNVTALGDVYIGTIGLGASGTNNVTSGAYKIGVYDELTYSNSTNVQAVLKDLDTQISSITGGAISGTGPAKYLVKYTGAGSTLGASVIYEDSNNIGIGTTNLGTSKLSVAGDIFTTTDLSINGIKLGSTGPNNTSSGAYKIGAYDEFTYSTATNVQAVLKDLDAQIVTLSSGTLSGTGPQNYVTKYLAGGITLGASSIYDNGTFVGIGTTAAGYKLNVAGDIKTSGDLYLGTIGLGASGASNITSGAYKIGTYDEFAYSNATNVQAVLKDLDTQIASVTGGSISGTGPAKYLTKYTGSGATLGASVIYEDSNNIGIGTTNLGTSKLTVAGDIYTTTDLSINGIKLGSTGPNNTSSGAYRIGALDEFTYSTSTNVQGVLKDLDTQITTLTGAQTGSLSGSGPMNYVTKYLAGGLTLSASTIYDNGTFVGIGTTVAGTSKLSVAGDIFTTTDISINGIKLGSTGPDNTSSGAYKIGTLDEFTYSNATNVQGVLKDLDTEIASVVGGSLSGTGPANYLTMYTGAGTTLGASVIYNNAGNIGIGTTNPGTSKLAVVGDISTTTDVSINGIKLGSTGPNNTSSGAYKIGAYDEFTYSTSTNVQGVLKDLDTQMGNALTGTGPAGYITKYTGTGLTLGTSVIYETGNNIGIGTTNPLSKLSVNGGTVIGTYAGISSAPTNGLIVSGNVGVGTSDPTSKFEVVGEAKAQKFTFQDYATTYIDTFGTNNMVFATNGTDKFTILSGGNVGVGTTNPISLFSVGTSSQFQVSSAGAITTATGVVSSGNIDFSSLSAGGLVKAASTSGRLSIAAAGTDYQTPLSFLNGLTNSSGTVKFGGTLTAATTLDLSSYNLEYTASGNGDFLVDGNTFYVDTGNNRVGIGISSPSTELEVVGEIRGSRFALQDSTGAYLDTISTNKLSLATNNAYRLTVDVNGLVGIGTTVPSAKLEVETTSGNNVVGLLIDQNDTVNNNVALEIQNEGTGNAIYVDSGEFIVDSTGNVIATGTTGLTLGANADVIFGSIGIRDVGATSTQSGAYLIGLNSTGLINTTANNVQEAIRDLDTVITDVNTGVITAVGSISSGAAFNSLASANDQWLGLGSTRGRIGFSTNPTDTIYLLSANVGIGLTTPAAVLDISGTSPANGSILKATGTVSGNNSKGIYFNPTLNATADNNVLNAMYIDTTFNSGVYNNVKKYALTITGNDTSMGLVRIGTGDSNPTHKLYVEGGIGLSEGQYINYGYTNGVSGYGFRDNGGSMQFKNSSGGWTDLGGDYWSLFNTTISPKNNYKVGIGTTSTTVNLAIGVTAANQEMIRLQDSTDKAGVFLVNANPDSSITGYRGSLALDYTNGAVYVNTNDGTAWSQLTSGGLAGTGPANYLTKYASTGTSLEASTLYETGGNLGIGTTVPGALVDISKTFSSADELLAGNVTMTHSTGDVIGLDMNLDYSGTSGTAGFKGMDMMLVGDSSVGSGNMYGIYMNTDSYFRGSLLYLAQDSNRVFEVNGVQSTFEVPVNMASSGDVSIANNLTFSNTTASFVTSDSPLYIQAGNAGEAESLYLSSAGSGDVYVDDNLYINQDLALNTGYKLSFDNDDSADTYFTHDAVNNRLGLWVDNQETARFIGVSSTASASLEIHGTLSQSQAFDVAEMYPTFDESIEPGMIVSLEKAEYGPEYTLTKARNSQDNNIFGIVSTKPGVIMGGGSFRDDFCENVKTKGADTIINEEIQKIAYPQQKGLIESLQSDVRESSESSESLDNTLDNTLAEKTGNIKEEQVDTIKDRVNSCLATREIPVALNGRVPVKIAENSQKISVGDSLTVSNSSIGYAQKATKGDDIIIGKALESWKPNSDNDSIMVITGVVWNNNKYAYGSNVLGTQSNLDAEGTLDSVIENIKGFGDAISLRNNGLSDILDINLDVNILGKTTLSDVTVIGEFKAGLTEIDSLDNSINIVGPECGNNSSLCESQTLHLQKTLAGNVDMFNGKMVFMPNGDVKISGTVEAEKVLASQYSVKGTAKSIGSSTITSGNKEITIETAMINASSKIFITPTNNTQGQTLYIKSKDTGTSFVVAIDNNTDSDITFDWFIVNVD